MTARHAFVSAFHPMDRVIIDGDPEVTATVVAIMFCADHHEIRVSWWHNGSVHYLWIEPARLSLVGGA